jgi:hypothetical protein
MNNSHLGGGWKYCASALCWNAVSRTIAAEIVNQSLSKPFHGKLDANRTSDGLEHRNFLDTIFLTILTCARRTRVHFYR